MNTYNEIEEIDCRIVFNRISLPWKRNWIIGCSIDFIQWTISIYEENAKSKKVIMNC